MLIQRFLRYAKARLCSNKFRTPRDCSGIFSSMPKFWSTNEDGSNRSWHAWIYRLSLPFEYWLFHDCQQTLDAFMCPIFRVRIWKGATWKITACWSYHLRENEEATPTNWKFSMKLLGTHWHVYEFLFWLNDIQVNLCQLAPRLQLWQTFSFLEKAKVTTDVIFTAAGFSFWVTLGTTYTFLRKFILRNVSNPSCFSMSRDNFWLSVVIVVMKSNQVLQIGLGSKSDSKNLGFYYFYTTKYV